MSLWKDNTAPRQTPAPVPEPREPARFDATPKPELVPGPVVAPAARVDTGLPRKESLIAADITIEGKIEGGGSVRIAGKFKGDVNVNGNLTIEMNASLTGQVNAKAIIIAGELNGNILGADKVELLESGVVNGDIKTGTLTVAAGSRMRGQVDFGWKDKG